MEFPCWLSNNRSSCRVYSAFKDWLSSLEWHLVNMEQRSLYAESTGKELIFQMSRTIKNYPWQLAVRPAWELIWSLLFPCDTTHWLNLSNQIPCLWRPLTHNSQPPPPPGKKIPPPLFSFISPPSPFSSHPVVSTFKLEILWDVAGLLKPV